MKVILSAEQRASILAGNTELEVDEATPGAGAATPPVTPPVAPPAAAAAPAAPTAPVAPVAPVAPAADTGVVAFLTAQIADKDKQLIQAGVDLAQAKAASASAVDALPGLLAIAQGVIGQMQVALGASDASAALSAKDAVAEHARLQPLYKAKFPIGGVSRTAPESEAAAAIHPAFAERLSLINAK